MRPWLITLIVLALLSGSARGQENDRIRQARKMEEERVRLIEEISPAVVAMFKKDGAGGGSGVIIDPAGYILTNFHVVGDAREMRAGLPGGKVLPCRVIGWDPSADLALVRILGVGPFPHRPLGDSNALAVGDWTLAMGNPFLLATDFRPTVTLGIVSGLHRFQPGGQQLIYHDCIQVDTPINPGNSGGPLFNLDGEVVGINGRISGGSRGRVNVGVGFAVSAQQIREVLPDLRAGKLVEHGTLEANLRDVPDRNPPHARRVIVGEMYEDSVAALAGIELGDEILRLDGTRIRSQNHFKNLIGILPEGRVVEVTFRREDDGADGGRLERTVRIPLARLPAVKPAWRESHPPDEAHVAWETERILRRYRSRTGADPDRPLAWEGVREGPDGSTARVVQIRSAHKFYRETEEAGSDTPRIVAVDDQGIRSGLRGGKLITLSEDVAPDIIAEIHSNRTIAYGDPDRFQSARFTGGKRIRGRLVDVVRTKLSEEDPEFEWFFDTETGLLSGYRFPSRAAGRPLIVLHSEHRETEGVLLPYRILRGVERGPGFEYRIQRYIPAGELPEEFRSERPGGEGREF